MTATEEGQRAWPSALLAPGGVLWLLRHDLRLAGRDLRAAGKRQRRTVGTVLLAVVALLHLLGFAMAPMLARLHETDRARALLVGSFALAGAFALFLSKAISEATDALFQRGDLDLLLSSPLPMRRVLTSRLLAIAVNAGFLPLLLVVPLVNGMVLRGEFAWIGVYPVLASLSVVAAAGGPGSPSGCWRASARAGPALRHGRWRRCSGRCRFLPPRRGWWCPTVCGGRSGTRCCRGWRRRGRNGGRRARRWASLGPRWRWRRSRWPPWRWSARRWDRLMAPE